MQNIFFFQTQQIHDTTNLFDQLKKQNIFFSYFLVKQADKQVNQDYYLFLYAQKSMDIHFLYQSLDVIQEMDSKQRKIRSLRGFFLYALEIMEDGTDYEILETNLHVEFLFGSDNGRGDSSQSSSLALDAKIQILQNQVDSLQQKVIQLESKLENPKYALSEPSRTL